MKKNIPFLVCSLLITALIISKCTNAPEPQAKDAPQGESLAAVAITKPDSIKIVGKDTIKYYTTTFIKCDTTKRKDSVIVPGPVTPPPDSSAYVRKNLLFESLFDDNNPWKAFNWPPQEGDPAAITASSEQARFGPKSMRIEVRAAWPPFAGAARSEVVPLNKDPMYADRWIGLSYYFPSATMNKDAVYDLITQWHPNTSNGSPFFSLRLNNGKWYIPVGQGNNINGNPDNEKFDFITLQPYIMDKWNDVVMHYKQSSGSDGVIEVWINGTSVYKKTGITSYPNIGSYLKIGLNKSSWPGGQPSNPAKRIFFIDNIRYGNEKATYQDVDPSKP